MLDRRLARCALLIGAAFLPLAAAQAQTPTPESPSPQPPSPGAGASLAPSPAGTEPSGDDFDIIVVTGQTTRGRSLITASADITRATAADIDRRAPKSVADLLELVPGIFVEGTAGALSNNYSVRGLQGGGQRFITIEEDGLPIIYQGGGADFFFQNDLTIDRLEAVKGGTSGILSVNGAGATINFISRRPNFDREEGIVRFSGYNFGKFQGDFYYTTPLTDNLAIQVGGYVASSPGVRRNPFNYDTYRVKAAIEYKFPSGGFARLTGRWGDQSEAYYATQPYSFRNGKVGGIAGLDTQFGNIGGNAFGRIDVPVSTFVEPDGFRTFRYSRGVNVDTWQIRLDIDKPVTDGVDVFVRARYLDLAFDFNGLFPGSGTGNGGLASATDYLTPGLSPISNILALGRTAFPGATRFGIKSLTNGVVIGANQIGDLNALNGNGLLQQTTLNHDTQQGYDFGSNFGARWEYSADRFKNSLTAGVMVYDVRRRQNQSATAAVLNDVVNNSNAYDVVALDANNQVIGQLTDNGLLSYGNWGAGIRRNDITSVSVYANDELVIGDKLHLDAGIRWETFDAERLEGNGAAVNQPVRQGVIGVVRDVGSTFDGTFTRTRSTQDDIAWTVGANYLIKPNFAVYGRYAEGFQTQGVDNIARVKLYEGGLRYQGHGLTAQVTYFHTDFAGQRYNFIDPDDPTSQEELVADYIVDGVEVDFTYQPLRWFALDFASVFQDPRLSNVSLSGRNLDFNGNRPERTPDTLITITPRVMLPNGKGEVFARYKYISEIFADNGNGLALPSYGVTSVGVTYNVSERLQLGFSAENIFDEIGLTEGNPRQGQTQSVSSGRFYARGIVGPTFGGQATLRF